MKDEKGNESKAIEQAKPEVPAIAPIKMQIDEIAAKVAEMEITDQAGYEAMAEYLKTATALDKDIEKRFEPAAKAAHTAWTEITGLRGSLRAPVGRVLVLARDKMQKFATAEDAKRRAEEEKLRKEAWQREQERKLTEAVELDEAGDKVAAEAVLAAPVVPPPVAPLARPSAAGITQATVKEFEVLDITKLKKEYLLPNTVELRKTVNALGEKAEEVVGVGAIKVKITQQARVTPGRSSK